MKPKKVNYWIDIPLFLIIFPPVFLISYAWMVVQTAYAYAEWYFSPENFEARYVNKKRS